MRHRYILSGIGLVENLMSIVILAIGLVAAIRCFTMALVYLNHAKANSLAVTLAQAELDEIRSLGFANYVTNMTAEVTATRATSTALADGSTQYTESLSKMVNPKVDANILTSLPQGTLISNPNGTALAAGTLETTMNPFMKKATVTITWSGWNKKTQSVTLVSFIQAP